MGNNFPCQCEPKVLEWRYAYFQKQDTYHIILMNSEWVM